MNSEKTPPTPAKRASMRSNAFRTHCPRKGTAAGKPVLESQICECGCGEEFIPTREWQRFKNTKHRKAAWAKSHVAENQIHAILRRLDRIEAKIGISEGRKS